ncbi:MAG: LuxR family transcriptional regulator [Oscillochloris sp.]|nr:LuxR family transcriptional regulator [Oscillochloris sp.]
MPDSLLKTKLFIPPPRSDAIRRDHLIARLDAGLPRKLTLVSAPAGFGKTTLLSTWLVRCGRPAAWLSLDAADSDIGRFLSYLVAALQTCAPQLGTEIPALLESRQPPPIEALLTTLLNEISALCDNVVLILDDYHAIEATTVDHAITFLLDHLPPQLHLVIATREDPNLPLARFRARDQLTELRAADLRFTLAEVAEYLNRVMNLNLADEAIAALDARTEGWIAGLHLAALSLQGQPDTANFIASFTGSHKFVLDYLVEEVLQRQSKPVQNFMLRTSILNRLCGSLCDSVLNRPAESGQTLLEDIVHANLFIIPLDNERRWYRYHHLFRDLLRKRIGQIYPPEPLAEYQIRASQWFEDHGLIAEAFHYAAAASDVERAERLIESKAMPLHMHSTVNSILDWLWSLPAAVLDSRPSLWVKSATLALIAGRTTGVAARLQAAARALPPGEPDATTRNLIGIIAAARATLAVTQYQSESILAQSRRALEYLNPTNLPFRFTAFWALGVAHQLQGDRAAAVRAYREAITISEESGDRFSTILATESLGEVQEQENQLYPAAESYRRVLELCGDSPQPNAGEAYLGLARICYEWNDLDAGEHYCRRSLSLLQQYDAVIDRCILAELFLARLHLARGDVAGAAAQVAEVEQSVRRRSFLQRMPEVAAVQVLVLLRQDDPAAAQLAQRYELPLSQARVHLARGEPAAALTLLEPLRRQYETKGWQDERLKVLVLESLALHAQDEREQALQLLGEALDLAEPGGFIRLFRDEGESMRQLLTMLHSETGRLRTYIGALLAAFAAPPELHPASLGAPPSPEPLSRRELEILRLIAQGLSNQEIAERLYLSLATIKGHNRRIFAKLQVQRRTEAVAQARESGLL